MENATVKVKICGITNLDDGLAAAELGADALGFVFYPKSPRYIEPDRAREIISRLGPFVIPVGVFVNERKEKVGEVIAVSGIEAVQLHGEESPAYCASFGNVKVIKAFRVSDDFDPALLGDYEVDAALLDAYRKDAYGGTGETFTWGLAQKAKAYGRIILAGGLTPENVASAIREVRPYAVDVSSGVEKTPGIKDREKMRGFMDRVNLTVQE
ncbi:MAG: phosphoribosylanthranilate isomerase [Candidatus Latescibacterota bacterium]